MMTEEADKKIQEMEVRCATIEDDIRRVLKDTTLSGKKREELLERLRKDLKSQTVFLEILREKPAGHIYK